MSTKLKRSRRTTYGIKKGKGSGSDLKGKSRSVKDRDARWRNFLATPHPLKGRWWTHLGILKGQNNNNGTIEILVRYKNHKDTRGIFKGEGVVDDIVQHLNLALLRNFLVTETRAQWLEIKRRKS